MALNDESLMEKLKRALGLGDSAAPQTAQVDPATIGKLLGATQSIPTPETRPDPAQVAAQAQMLPATQAVAQPVDEQKKSGLLGAINSPLEWIQPDATKREALQDSLVDAGAAMMIGGAPQILGGDGPINNWMSILGQGIGTGHQSYKASLADQLKADEKKKKDELQAEMAKTLTPGVTPGASNTTHPAGNYTPEQLMQFAQQLMAAGDTDNAIKVLMAADALRKGQADKGNIIGPDGKIMPAPNSLETDAARKFNESRNSQLGTESAIRTEKMRNDDAIKVDPSIVDREAKEAGAIEGAKPTGDIKNFEYGVKNPSFQKQQDLAHTKASTKITDDHGNEYPAPDKGYRYVKNADGTLKLEIIPGSEPDMKAKDIQDKKDKTTESKQIHADAVTGALDDMFRLRKGATLPTTGFIGSMLTDVPGTAAHDISQSMNTVKANAAFDRLQEMRDNSPTGGALGGVSEKELALLQSASAALEQSQTDDQFVRNSNRFYNTYMDIVHGKGNGPARRKLDDTTNIIKKDNNKKEVAKPADNRPGLLNSTKVMTDEVNRQTYSNAPPIGTVKNGHRYMGGKVNDPSNWALVN